MSSKADQFSDEEKKHLSYLGSMLRRPLSDFDAEVERILAAGGVPKDESAEAQEESWAQE